MSIAPEALRDMLVDGGEIALVDVREEAEFGAGHILLAVNVPRSRLELLVPRLVPRLQARVVVCDGRGEGAAHRAAACLEFYGYDNVQVLAGGVRAWEAAGLEVFTGVNVPSKLFGEFVEHHYHTPSLSAEELRRRMDAGDDLVVLDSRPLDEYRDMNIPGSTCMPGGELVYRVGAVAPNPDTTVVVNCAGRTRSIIGAQSLINAGIPNPVVALRNGTMGWHLAGFELERGAERYLPQVNADVVANAKALTARVAERFPVTHVDLQTLNEWQRCDAGSVFLLDVRSPEEYEAGHIPASICAPGGQLVQATDRYVGTLRARIVLVDDDGVRAAMTASWLAQLGLHEVVVLDRGLQESTLVRGPQPANVLGLETTDPPLIDVASLAQRLAGGRVAVMDLERSVLFRRGHIPGAVHAVRGHLHHRIEAVPDHDLLALTCANGLLARLALEEAAQLTDAEVVALDGGTGAWHAAGHTLVAGSDGLEDAPVDAFLRPYDRDKAVEEAMQSYLDWEIALIEQMQRDGTVRFRVG